MKKLLSSILVLILCLTSFGSLCSAETLGTLGTEYNEYWDKMSEEPREQLRLKSLFEGDELGYHRCSFFIGMTSSIGICGPDGLIVYEQQEGEKILYYANGYFISRDDQDTYLKTAEGEVVYSASGLGVSGFGMLKDTERNVNFLRDGYVMAYSLEEGLSGVSFEVGILDVSGNWVVDLSSDMTLLTAGVKMTSDLLENQLLYVGEGCILLPVDEKDYKYRYRVYDLNADVLNGFQVVEGECSRSSVDNFAERLVFENGYDIFFNDRNAYTFSTDGSIRHQVIMPKEVNQKYSQKRGSIFLVDGTILTLTGNSKSASVLTDQNGILKEMNFTIVDGFAMEDGWMFAAENSEGTRYFGALDLNGDFLFEPQKTEAIRLLFEDGHELVFEGQKKGAKVIIDYDGNVLYEVTDENKELEIKNGIILETLYGEETYVDFKQGV